MADQKTEDNLSDEEKPNQVNDQKTETESAKAHKMEDGITGAEMGDRKTEAELAGHKDQEKNDYDDLFFRVLLCGNTAVGKTSLLKRYMDDTFLDEYFPTTDLNFKEVTDNTGSGKLVLQIWDMGGEQRSSPGCHSFYRDSHAVLMLYDVTSQDSFVQLKYWLEEVRNRGKDNVVKFIVGNKTDMDDAHVVELEAAQELARQEDAVFFEVSAKTGDEVKQLFDDVIFQLVTTFELHDPVGRMQFSVAGRRLRRRYFRSVCCCVT